MPYQYTLSHVFINQVEQDATLAEDELSRLQAALTDMMNREGNLLHNEMLGAQRFVGVVAEGNLLLTLICYLSRYHVNTYTHADSRSYYHSRYHLHTHIHTNTYIISAEKTVRS